MLNSLKNYVEKRIQLVKLELIGVFADMASGLVSAFLILLFSMFILLMLSFSAAFWIGETLDSFALGFVIVGGIYLVLFSLYLLFGKSQLNNQIKDAIVLSALKNDNKTDDDNTQIDD